MAETVYKYLLPGNANEFGEFKVSLPIESKVIHVDIQNGQRVLWAQVNNKAPLVDRRVVVVGTGRIGPDDLPNLDHVSTFFEGPFVWHVFVGPEDDD